MFPGSPEHPQWQEEDRLDHGQYPVHSHAEQAEWQEEQPYDRIQNERQQGQRPAEDEQDKPEQESNHGIMCDGLFVLVLLD